MNILQESVDKILSSDIIVLTYSFFIVMVICAVLIKYDLRKGAKKKK